MEESLIAKLLANTAIAAMVGDAVEWVDRPDALPAITLMQVGPGRIYTHDGADNLTQPLIQFDFWGRSQKEAALLERLVTAEMETASINGGVAFGMAFLEAQNDFDPEKMDGGVTAYRRTSDWRIYSTPTS
jgi:hypothetical protein